MPKHDVRFATANTAYAVERVRREVYDRVAILTEHGLSRTIATKLATGEVAAKYGADVDKVRALI